MFFGTSFWKIVSVFSKNQHNQHNINRLDIFIKLVQYKIQFQQSFLRNSRYSGQSHVCNNPDIVSQHTPHHLCLKMLKTFPVTNPQVKAPFEVWNNGFNTTAPFLQTGFHTEAGGNIFKAFCHFIENDVYNTFWFTMIWASQAGISAISGWISGYYPVIIYCPVNSRFE